MADLNLQALAALAGQQAPRLNLPLWSVDYGAYNKNLYEGIAKAADLQAQYAQAANMMGIAQLKEQGENQRATVTNALDAAKAYNEAQFQAGQLQNASTKNNIDAANAATDAAYKAGLLNYHNGMLGVQQNQLGINQGQLNLNSQKVGIDQQNALTDAVYKMQSLQNEQQRTKILNAAQQLNTWKAMDESKRDALRAAGASFFQAQQLYPNDPDKQQQMMNSTLGYLQQQGHITKDDVQQIQANLNNPATAQGTAFGAMMYGSKADEINSALKLAAPNASKNNKQATETFNQENTLRDEASSINKNFQTTLDTHNRIISAQNDTSPAGDMNITFGLMKLINPNARINYGQTVNMQDADGIPGYLVKTANSLVSDTPIRLTTAQRADYINQANKIYNSAANTYGNQINYYTNLAKSYGLDPQHIALDLRNSNQSTSQASITPADITFTAQKYGITEDQVKQRLGIQ